jgi:hypothetical protein
MSGIETKQSSETPREKLRRETSESLNWLRDKVKFNNDPWIIKQPTLENWAAVFDYKYMWWKWEIVTRKEGNGKYSVRIKKWVKLPNWKEWWQTQKNGNNETFPINANDKLTFNRELWTALDTIIWKKRDRLPNTGWRVFDLLNTWNTTAKRIQESVETKGLPKWLTLDHWTYVYTVQSWDCESKIKQKLSKYTPLSYVKNIPNGISWWNFDAIPDNKLLPWLKIPVPKPKSERIKTISNFKASQKTALNEMKNNSVYWDYVKNLIKKYWENHIVSVMAAYAKNETSPEVDNSNIWNFALIRYEERYKCPSYGYHHVMYMESGLRAFKKLWMSIWQACNPKDSWKLFLAFCIEKSPKDYRKYFDLKNNTNLQEAARRYNWPRYKKNKYDTRLKMNFERAINI